VLRDSTCSLWKAAADGVIVSSDLDPEDKKLHPLFSPDPQWAEKMQASTPFGRQWKPSFKNNTPPPSSSKFPGQNHNMTFGNSIKNMHVAVPYDENDVDTPKTPVRQIKKSISPFDLEAPGAPRRPTRHALMELNTSENVRVHILKIELSNQEKITEKMAQRAANLLKEFDSMQI
jgi:hypothetical protein